MRMWAYCLVLCSLAFTVPVMARAVDPVTREQALKALQDLGADVENSSGRCAGCHDPNLITINTWLEDAQKTYVRCLAGWNAELTVSSRIPRPDRTPATPLERVNCLRVDPENADSDFSPQQHGFLCSCCTLESFF